MSARPTAITKQGEYASLLKYWYNHVKVWQNYRQQYEKCGVDYVDCTPSITTRQICQDDEVIVAIKSASSELPYALSFQPDTTYYLISEYVSDNAYHQIHWCSNHKLLYKAYYSVGICKDVANLFFWKL